MYSDEPKNAENHDAIYKNLMTDAYEAGVVINNYNSVLKDIPNLENPSDEFLSSLSFIQLIAAIAHYFHADHFDKGCLVRVVGNGILLKYFREVVRR